MGAADFLIGLIILQRILQIGNGFGPLPARITQKAQENQCQTLGIVVGTVGRLFIVGNTIVTGNVAKTIRPPIRHKCPGHIQGIDRTVLQFRAADAAQLLIEEIVVEGRIMGDKHSIPEPCQKFVDGFRKRLRLGDHFIGDVGLQRNVGRNGMRRFDEKLLRLHDFAIADPGAAEFNDRVIVCGKAGRLKVEGNVLSFRQQGIHRVAHNAQPAVGHIHFTSESDLELPLRIALLEFGCRVIGLDEGLHVAMVRDADAGHAEIPCIFDDLLRFADAVHFAHVRMHVQFDALFHGRIRDGNGRTLIQMINQKNKIFGIGIHTDGSGNGDTVPFADFPHFFDRAALAFEALGQNGRSAVIQRKCLNMAAGLGFDRLKRKNRGFKAHVVNRILNILQLDRRIVFGFASGVFPPGIVAAAIGTVGFVEWMCTGRRSRFRGSHGRRRCLHRFHLDTVLRQEFPMHRYTRQADVT